MRSASPKIPFPGPLDDTPIDIFLESVLKLQRARLHAHEVSTVWEELVENHFKAASGEKMYLFYKIEEHLFAPPIHPQISLALGDCIRNLRSALDYLVSALARRSSLSDDQTIFPFNKLKSGLEASFNEPSFEVKNRKPRKAGALYELSRKHPELKNIILHRIKPYSADDGSDPFGDLLWRIITADNVDKHRLMTPSVQRIEGANVTTSGPTMFTMTGVNIEGGTPFRFAPGTQIQNDSDFSLDIVFREPTTLAGKPVTSTLIEGCNAVGEVIKIFRDQFCP